MIAVLDASAFAPIIVPDEREAVLPGLQDALATEGMMVPTHWHLEVANLLLMAMRRGRISSADRDYAERTIAAILVEVDGAAARHSLAETWDLAERHRLTIYDAAYLELAKRSGLPLATADKALRHAAPREGVSLFPL